MHDNAIGAVVIGRNEGERLIKALKSLIGATEHIVYVDSASTDRSVEAAKQLGAQVVDLDTAMPFTAARARNAGLEALLAHTSVDYIQFIDGDCEVREGWLERAKRFLDDTPQAAVVCGRRRERYPDASVFNRLIDMEWDTPIGRVRSCGGDALMRTAALVEVDGYNPDMIAGEEPELCVRLRAAGWTIHRIDAEMTWHDAAMTRLSQWWKRARRAGHAYAEGAALHGRPPERHNVVQTRRAVFWGFGIPLLAILVGSVSPAGWLILLAWPAQILRLGFKMQDMTRAAFLTFGKIPEAFGVFEYMINRIMRRKRKIIEYK